MTMTPCTVYIDEAGDLGANRGTQWFVLTAVIVDKGSEPIIRAKMQQIKTRLNLQVIHFRNVKDFGKRSYIVKELSEQDFTCIHILFDTNQFDRQKLPTDVIAYNYICRYLIERISWYLRDTGRIGRIVLSSRGTSRDVDLIRYIQNKLIPYTENQVASVFTGVTCMPASAWDMLQLADICATSMFYSHEINGYGFITPCYALRLWNKNYRYNGKLDRYGIKYFSDDMKPARGSLQRYKICET